MPVGTLILVETSSEGNLGAAFRVAANFAVPRVHLVRPVVDPDGDEVTRWSCGARLHLDVRCFESLADAAEGCRTVVATASGRGRENQPLITPAEAAVEMASRGLAATALVFGNETSGLTRAEVDACDMVLHVPTQANFPVLNLTQAVAIVLAYLSMQGEPPEPAAVEPAPTEQVDALMAQLETTLLGIGFLDPANPQRMLRKLRRLLGRAGVSENEVAILRGICRQIDWATRPDVHRDESNSQF